jgi:MFS family permease
MRNGENTKPEEDYIITESPEVSIGENTRWVKLLSAFPALKNPHYQKYFFGQFVSLIGSWLQIVAQSWLVLSLTDSPFIIGLVMAMATAPSLVFALFGGVIVDRFSKKKILYITQTASMVLALVLGVLTLQGLVSVPVIATIAFMLGTVNAIDAPARQAFVSELVTEQQLPSAIALNSSIFNGARVIGPGFAGLLIALVGTGGAFILNGVSYIAVIVALYFIDVEAVIGNRNLKPMQAIKDGLVYSFTHPVIRIVMIFVGLMSIFGWSYSTLMPIVAKHTFHLQAKGLGYLYAATGLGSLLGTLVIGVLGDRVRRVYVIVSGAVLFALSIALIGFTTALPLALVLLFFAGAGLLAQAAMSNTMVQSMVKPDYRGRVMSIYVLMFLGLAPVGNFEIGLLAEHFGTSTSLLINALVVMFAAAVVFVYKDRIRAAYLGYKEANGS